MIFCRSMQLFACVLATVLLAAGLTRALLGADPPEGDVLTKASLAAYSCEPPTHATFQQSPFGLHAAGNAIRNVRDLNARFVRIIVLWQQIESQPGQLQFTRVDHHVRAIQRAGLDLVVTLRPVSRWGVDVDYAALKSKRPRHPWTRFSGYPRDVQTWLTFVRQLVERYDGDDQEDMPGLQRPIRYWQLGNEVLWQWQGGEKRYLELLGHTSRTIRAANPEAKVILGAVTAGLRLAKSQRRPGASMAAAPQDQATRAIGEALKEGAPYFDIVDFHSYDDEPYGLALQTCWLRRMMDDAGIRKPIWSLENAGPFDDFTPGQFAVDVVKRHAIAMAYGVETLFWSSLKPTMGWSDKYRRLALLDRSGRKTPAYHTYRILSGKLASIRSMEVLPSSSALSTFRAQTTNREVFIVWSDRGDPQTWSFPWQQDAADVTHLITSSGVSRPAIERVPAENGVLNLRVTAPVFVEPVAP